MKVTGVFDIGKTNKKFFLFDKNYQEVYRHYKHIEEIKDEDGYPTDDLAAIEKWAKSIFEKILINKDYNVRAINFSCYGASLVHIDEHGQPVTPLYNYLKPLPYDILEGFYKKYGSELQISKETSSPPLKMLNSGLQLYWLKYARPKEFKKIRWSMHFPQYISYLFTGEPLSEYTSIGCHTMMWDYVKQDYHRWIYEEGIDQILPPIVDTSTCIDKDFGDRSIKFGVGIHDSSAALIPYIQADLKPFLLISTGTWSISLNPNNDEILSSDDLKNDCLNFMRTDGGLVKAGRLFLGNEYKLQIGHLDKYYSKETGYHKTVKYRGDIVDRLKRCDGRYFKFTSIQSHADAPETTVLDTFDNYEVAYHQLMIELMELQIGSINRAIGNTVISKLYVDGGFADNEIFVHLLADAYPNLKLRTTATPLGSALGGSMIISDVSIGKGFLKKKYNLKKNRPSTRIISYSTVCL